MRTFLVTNRTFKSFVEIIIELFHAMFGLFQVMFRTKLPTISKSTRTTDFHPNRIVSGTIVTYPTRAKHDTCTVKNPSIFCE